MRKQFLVLGVLLTPALAMAATPDFSGTWTRNAAGSDPTPNLMYWMTRAAPAGPRGGGQRAPEVQLTVKLDGKSMHVTESNASVREYTLDGTAHSRPTETGIQKAVVTAKLQGDTLEIDTTQPFGGMPGNATLNVKEVWALSQDGKTLTITTTRDVPARHETYKQVYSRSQAQPATICSAGCVAAP